MLGVLHYDVWLNHIFPYLNYIDTLAVCITSRTAWEWSKRIDVPDRMRAIKFTPNDLNTALGECDDFIRLNSWTVYGVVEKLYNTAVSTKKKVIAPEFIQCSNSGTVILISEKFTSESCLNVKYNKKWTIAVKSFLVHLFEHNAIFLRMNLWIQNWPQRGMSNYTTHHCWPETPYIGDSSKTLAHKRWIEKTAVETTQETKKRRLK